MAPDLNKLRAFYQVAKAGGFTQASKRLGIDHTTLSRQISALEKDYKTTLFNRHHRGVTLTEKGEVLFDSARKILSEIELSSSLLLEDSEEPSGRLKLSAPVATASLWLMQYVPGFLKKYPNIRLCFFASNEAIDFSTRETDVAIRPFQSGRDDLVQKFLLSINFKLWANPEYLKKYGILKKVEDLDKHRLIAFSRDYGTPLGEVDWHLWEGTKKGFLREAYFEINSSIGSKAAAEKGLGIASLAEDHPGLQRSNLVEVLPKQRGVKIDLCYVYPKVLAHSKRVTVFGDYLVDIIAKKNH